MTGRQPHIIGVNVLFALRRLPKISAVLRQAPRESEERIELEQAIERLSQDALLAAERLFAALSPSPPAEQPRKGARRKRQQETAEAE